MTKDLNSSKMNDFLINDGLPVTLYSNLLIFGDSNESFKLEGDIFETLTNYDFNADHSNPQDRKTIYEFGKERNFKIMQNRRKSPRDQSVMRLLKSPAIMPSVV